MTYYNPAIYNYANLHREDQATVKVMYDIFKDLENMEEDPDGVSDASTDGQNIFRDCH